MGRVAKKKKLEFTRPTRRQNTKKMRKPGVEPGAQRWQL